jgi:molecular chaperone GrpE
MSQRKSERSPSPETQVDPRERGGSDRPGDPSAVHGTEDHDLLSPDRDAAQEAEAELGSQLDDLQHELDSLNERHLRLAAEFKNYRRRAESEMGETWSRAQSDLVRRFLDVLDDLQRVSGLDPSDGSVKVEAIVEGVDLVERKFVRALEEAGVEVFDPVGERFDPERMEAVMKVVTHSAEEDDRVAQVFQRGYMLKGHLIRPARVSVSQHE